MAKLFIHGLVAGLLSAAAGIIYFYLYQGALECEFDQIINVGSILGASLIGCMLMTSGYAALNKLKKESLVGWLNILIVVLSFASIAGPIVMSLPLNIKDPELFPGLVIPMHFFPALAFLAVSPFFSTRNELKHGNAETA